MFASFLPSLVLFCVLQCGSAFLFRFPGRFRASRACMVRTEKSAPKAVAKIGNRRFVRKVAAPVSESPDKSLITKIDQNVETNADESIKRTEESDDMAQDDLEGIESEEEDNEDEDEDEPLSIEVFKPPERYHKTFVCVADVLNNDMCNKRSDLFAPHLQWARRSILSQHLEPFEHQNNQTGDFYTTDKVLVKSDYTLLTDDCTAPATQLLLVRSDNVSNVHEYLSLEPLAAHQAVSPWKVFEFVLEQNSSSRFLDNEEEEQHKLDEIFDNDLLSGFLLLSLCNNVTTSITTGHSIISDSSGGIMDINLDKTDEMRNLVDNSFRYHAKAARMEFVKPEDRPQETDAYLPLYDETARIVTIGRLYHTNPPTTTTTTTNIATTATTIAATATVTGSPSSVCTESTGTKSTDTNTDSTSFPSYPYTNPYLTHDDEDYPEPGVLAGQLVFFNALSRADAIRYLKRDPLASSGLLSNQITNKEEKGKSTGLFDRMTLSVANEQDVSGMHHYMPRDYVGKYQFDTVHFMDPEDLLLQNDSFVPKYTDFIHTDSTKDIQLLPPLPNLPDHYQMNANLLRQLDVYNVSFRYNRLKFDPIVTDIYSDFFGYSTNSDSIDDLAKDTTPYRITSPSYSGHSVSNPRSRRKRGGFVHEVDDSVIDVEHTEDDIIDWDEELLRTGEMDELEEDD